jgi:uncharacterized protein (TIGR02246 family)
MSETQTPDHIVAAVEASYAAAYSAADPERLGRLFTPDATVQTEWGPILDGRNQIVKGLVALFAAKPTSDDLTNTPKLSRQIAEDVIVSHGTSTRRPSGGPVELFLYTRVYVNHRGAWLLASNHIARPSEHVQPSGIGS